MTAFYNEIDKSAAEWIRELIKAGLVAPGVVDERSIEDIKPNELRGFTQLHFFAGIAVWSFALRRAGWRDDRRVITGSCPCQPFSTAGKGAGLDDERHLWPAWFHIIHALQGYEEWRGVEVFGEQVSSKDGLAWLDIVSTDLEGADYTVRAADICAAGVGAPHIRQRLYFVADTTGDGYAGGCSESGREIGRREPGRLLESAGWRWDDIEEDWTDEPELVRLVDTELRRPEQCDAGQRSVQESDAGRSTGGTAGHPEHSRHDRPEADPPEQRSDRPERGISDGTDQSSPALVVGDAISSGLEGLAGHERNGNEPGWLGTLKTGSTTETGFTNGFWRDIRWIYCRDAKYRPVPTEPRFFPLVAKSPGRVALLRGAGNSIVAECATEFIKAYREVKGEI